MKIRKYCFIAFLLLLTSIAGAEERPTPEEVKSWIPAWDANKEAFTHTHVFQIVGNEDNSLFLLNVVAEEGWHNIIYAAAPDKYFSDRKIYKVWDQSAAGGDVRSLIFSPFSKKFYFTACWMNSSDLVQRSQGLWVATQTQKSWASLSHSVPIPLLLPS